MPQFDLMLPQHADLVRSALTRCWPSQDNLSKQMINESLDDQQLKTADDLLKVASATTDLQLRVIYLLRAANAKGDEEKFEDAIAILEGMNTDERDKLKSWDNWRWTYASLAAAAYAKKKDFQQMNRIVYSTPRRLRPVVQISLADHFQPTTASNRETAIGLLTDAQDGLTKADAYERVPSYLALLRRSAVLTPTLAPTIFQEMLEAMNKEQKEAAEDAKADAALSDWSLSQEPIRLPAALLKVDEYGVTQAVNSLQRLLDRVEIRLGLLNASLELHREARPRIVPGTGKRSTPSESENETSGAGPTYP